MIDYNLLKTKTLCLQVYFFVTESSESARKAIETIENGESNSNALLVTCNQTIDFANKIIDQLGNYKKDVDNYVSEINKSLKKECKNVQIKKGLNTNQL